MPSISPQACTEAFAAAMIRKDIDTALQFLTDDAVFFYSNGSAIWGKRQFAAVMTANWKLIDRYTYRTVESVWLAQSDTATVVAYTFAWSGVANGQNVSGGGRGTRALRRDRETWQIAHEHLSSGQWKP